MYPLLSHEMKMVMSISSYISELVTTTAMGAISAVYTVSLTRFIHVVPKSV